MNATTLGSAPLQLVRTAVRANLLPAVVLWSALAVFLMAYSLSASVQAGMGQWIGLKTEWGLAFAFASYVVFAVLLPEALQCLLARRLPGRTAWVGMGYSSLVFGGVGILVDLFYRYQVIWFGAGNDWATILKKTLLDQLVFAPLSNLLMLGLFLWRDEGFALSSWGKLSTTDYLGQRFVPVMVALWAVWIPSIMVVYCLPTPLQFPVVSMILSFWVLIFKFIRQA